MYFLLNNFNKVFAGIILILSGDIIYAQKVVRYELTLADTIVNFTGKSRRAIASNGIWDWQQSKMPIRKYFNTLARTFLA